MKLRPKPKSLLIPGFLRAGKVDIPESLALPGKLEIAAVQKDAEGKEKLPLIHLSANSGEPMNLTGFPFPVVIDFVGASFDKPKTPIIMDHDTSLRLGYTTKQEIGEKITADGLVSSTSEVAKSFISDARGGFPFQVSVGASIQDGYIVEEGDTDTVNGRTVSGPVIVASKSKIRELSVLVLGADSKTSAIVAKVKNNPSSTGVHEMKFAEWLKAYCKSLGLDVNKLTDDQKTRLKATYDAEIKAGSIDPPKKPEDPPTAPGLDLKKIAAQHEKIERVSEIFAKYEDVKGPFEIDGQTFKTRSALKAHAIEKEWSEDKVELNLIHASRPDPEGFRGIHMKGTPENELLAQSIRVSMLRKMNVPALAKSKKDGREFGVEKWYSEKELEAADHVSVRNISLTRIFDLQIQAAGMAPFIGDKTSKEYFQTVKEANRLIRAAGQGFTTLGVANIFDDVMHKATIASYQMYNTVWDQIAQVKSLNDFRAHNFYRLDVHGGYSKVNSDGKLAQGTMTDAKYSLQADTYGMLMVLGRQQMINDDLGVLENGARSIARLAALVPEELVWDLLGTNKASFPTVATNKDLSIDGITEAEQIYADQVDSGGKPILVSPDRLIVGTQDSVLAKDLFGTRNLLADGVGNAASRDFAENPHVGKYRPLSSPYMNNTSIKKVTDGTAITGQTSNHWFLSGDPGTLAAILIGFLNGNQVPTTETDDTAFDTLGIQVRSYHDVGVGMGDLKAMVYSAGA